MMRKFGIVCLAVGACAAIAAYLMARYNLPNLYVVSASALAGVDAILGIGVLAQSGKSAPPSETRGKYSIR